MLVREVMTHRPVSTTATTTVKEALVLLAEHRVTSLPVRDAGGRLVGVVSEADLIRELVPTDPRGHELPVTGWHDTPHTVGEVMSTHPVTVRPETDVATAVELLTSTTVKSVPVLDDTGHLVGMFSRSDVVRVLSRADEELARDVDAHLVDVGLDQWTAEVTDGVVTLIGPSGASDRALADLMARTVPGVVDVVGP